MSFSKYVSSFNGLISEITEMLETEYDIEKLSNVLKKYSEGEWNHWMIHHEKEALIYLSQAPKQREKKPVWKNDGEKPLIMLTALVLAKKACVLAECSDRLLFTIVGMSYRNALAFTANNAIDAELDMYILWPFAYSDPWDESDVDD